MVQAGLEPATLASLCFANAISILKSISTTLYQLSYRTVGPIARSETERNYRTFVLSNSTLGNRAELQDLTRKGLPHAYHIESLTL